MLTPRFYQIRAVDTIIQRFESGATRQILSLATGLGKTICFALLAKKLDVRTLIIAHRSELLSQAAAKVSLVWPGVDIGVVQGERNEIHAKVLVASVQTLSRSDRLKMLQLQNFGLIVVDECHHAVASSYKTVISELGFLANNPKRLLLGVTATPTRSDKIGLSEIFQEISFHMGIKEGIDQGFLAPLLGRQIFSKVDLKGIGMIGGDFNQEQLAQVINTPSRNDLIIESYKKHAADRKKTLAFCVDVQHAEDLAAAFNNNGITSKAVYGAMGDDERREVVKEFSEGKYRVLVNCMLLTEGFDESQIDCLVMARPTQSEPLFVQMIGRSTRLHPSKQNALILDFVDNSSKHRLCSITHSLEGVVKLIGDYKEKSEVKECQPEEKQEDVKVTCGGEREIDFFDSREFAWTKIGCDWHLSITPDCGVWVKKVSDGQFEIIARDQGKSIQLSSQPLPLDYGCGVGEDWARKQSKAAWARRDALWRTQPASPKQIDALSKCGFNFEPNITRGEAHQLLEVKFKEPATSKQIGWLRARGVEFPREISKVQARKLIAERMKVFK